MRFKIALAATAALALSVAAGAQAAPASSDLKVLSRIAGPDGAWDYAGFDPVHRRLYIAHGDVVSVVDVDTGKLTPKLAAAHKAHIALPLPGGDEVLITNGANDTAVIIDARSGAVRATIPTGKSPDAALVDPASKLVFVMNGHGGGVTLVDIKAGKAVGSIPLEGTLEFGAADGKGRVFVNIEDKGEIAVIDTAQRKVVAHWPMAGCEEPSGLAYAEASKLLIAACANGQAKAVSAETGKVVRTLVIGPKPDAAFFDASRGLAYIPSGGDGTLSVIAVRGPTDVAVVGKAVTAAGARTGAVDPKTGRIYLPSAEFAPAAKPDGKPTPKPGTFSVLVVGR